MFGIIIQFAYLSHCRYIYTKELALTEKNVISILRVSEAYAVSKVSCLCLKYLNSAIKSTNACTILNDCYNMNTIGSMNDVIRQCVDVIVKNADIVFKSDAFFKLSSGALELVIKSDDLVMPEVDIFYCCVKWAKVQLKKQECDVTGDTLRRMLGNVLRCIRFPLMPSSSFASAITAYAVLTDVEELSVYRSIAKRDAHIFLTPDNTHMTFSSVPRKVTQATCTTFSLSNL